jgi:hypothetical protein
MLRKIRVDQSIILYATQIWTWPLLITSDIHSNNIHKCCIIQLATDTQWKQTLLPVTSNVVKYCMHIHYMPNIPSLCKLVFVVSGLFPSQSDRDTETISINICPALWQALTHRSARSENKPITPSTALWQNFKLNFCQIQIHKHV